MLRPDTLLHNRYRIVRQIGQGGFGAVYEAVDQRLNRRVALKQLIQVSERISRQFTREAELLANLSHPALPNVIDYFGDPLGQFLVMDFIAGDDLGAMLVARGDPFPVEQVLGWADQLLDALDFLHTHDPPIIHRDIKPQNLKLRPRGRIVLLDFGLAKGYAGDVAPSGTSSLMAYTRGYAPPEQVEGLGTDARSDLYALGATLYMLLTNVPPVEAPMRLLAAARQRPDPMRPAHVVNPAVPEGVSRVLVQALALEPQDRPPDAETMRALLEAAPTVPAPPPSDALPGVVALAPEVPTPQPAAAPAVGDTDPTLVTATTRPLEVLTTIRAQQSGRAAASASALAAEAGVGDELAQPAPAARGPRRRSGQLWLWLGLGGVALALLVAGVILGRDVLLGRTATRELQTALPVTESEGGATRSVTSFDAALVVTPTATTEASATAYVPTMTAEPTPPVRCLGAKSSSSLIVTGTGKSTS